ncbi:hypothetical protein [Streptomyces sp. NPDC001568]|uniref:hypothetical protein n=1 Tax=Streptomyces sp. NPDC001568 TaxID=3364588 RepID=UPI0036826DD1
MDDDPALSDPGVRSTTSAPQLGLWLTNVRRPGGLGKDPVRARRRADELAAIDPDWNPGPLGWTVDWQRHLTYPRQALTAGAGVDDIVPGVTRHGDDIGRRLATQRRDWNRLNAEQRRRLGGLGVTAAVRVPGTATGPAPERGGAAFEQGLEALARYVRREGTGVVPRGHVELLPYSGEHRTGVWLMNHEQRRDRLDPRRLAALAALGVDWAR